MSFYQPNLPILPDWKGTLTVAFAQLRRAVFVVEDSFTWNDFDPQINFNGMTVTNYNLLRSRILKLGKFVSISVHFTATLAAPLAAFFTLKLPYTAGTAGVAGTSAAGTPYQGGACTLLNSAVQEVGVWKIQQTGDTIFILRSPVANFGAGSLELIFNEVIEVI